MDALNRSNAYVYDGMGRKVVHVMPGSQTESFGYDLAGNLLLDINFNGAIITNQYDAMNRLTNVASANGYQVGYSYSATGQRLIMADHSGTTTYAYDNRDRLISKTNSWAGGPTAALYYGYDANGNVTSLGSSSSGGVTNVYQYDPLNRLTNVLANGSVGAGYGFDLVGNLQSMHYGNGVTNLYQYDSLNRLTSSVWRTNGTPIASFGYTLGLTGMRTALTETNGGSTRNYTWQYDTLYRLTNELIAGTAPLGTLAYSYDAVGNRLTRTNSSGSLGLANQTLAFNTNDWLKSDSYDSNGNTLWSTNGSIFGPYAYDVENHLTNYNSAVYISYNGDGSRVKKTVGSTTTYYLLDDRNPTGYEQVLEEWTVIGAVTNLSKVYNYGLSLISQRTLSPQLSTNYFIYDGHGSTRMLADAGGNVVNAFAYDAYGTLIVSNGTAQTVYLYCRQQWDPDLGLYYNRVRYLNPNAGRLWTMDSYAGDNEDQLSLHKYLYAECDPVDGTDPSGNDDDIPTEMTALSIETEGVVLEGVAARAELTVEKAILQRVETFTYSEIRQAGLNFTERMTKSAFNKLVKSIQKNGLQDKVIKCVKADDENYIVFGNNRVLAAQKLGITDQLVFKQVDLPFKGFNDIQDVITAAAESAPSY